MTTRPIEAPHRPTLPPLFIAALCGWVTIALVEQVSWDIFAGKISVAHVCLLVSLAAILLVASFFCVHCLKRSGRHRGVAVYALPSLAVATVAMVISLVCGSLCWMNWEANVSLLPSLLDNQQTVEMALTEDPSERDYGIVSTGEIAYGNQKINVRILWPDESDACFAGHSISVKGNVLSPQINESGRWCHRNGCVGTIKAASIQELGYSDSFRGFVARFRDESFASIESLPGDSAGLLSGVLLGNKTLYAGTELELAFQTTGLAHLMAVSGTHLAIVTMLLSLILGKLPIKRLMRTVLLIVAIGFYVALTGFASSAIRAFVMCSAALIVGILNRRPDIVSSLSLCAFVFIGLSPTIIFSAGFQLSVLAVFGLVLFGNLATYWIGQIVPFLPEIVRSSIAATLAASVTTLPVTIPLFAQLPIISPLANLIVAPLVTASLSLGILGITIGSVVAPIGSILLAAASIIANISAKFVHLLADVPGACLPISSGSLIISILFTTLFAALWITWPLPKEHPIENGMSHVRKFATRAIGTVCCLALPLIIAAFIGFGQFQLAHQPSSSRLVMLDVGQGDSILIQSGEASVLVDTGERSDVLVRELAEKSVSHLDAIFITHKDADHAGALKKLAGIVNVDHVYVHEDLLGKEVMNSVLEAADWSTAGKGAEGVSPGFTVRLDELTLSVVAPEHGGESKNEDSLVMLVEFDAENDGIAEVRGVLTGDAEQDAMEHVAHQVGDIDFLKVAHHGSKGGLNEEQIKELSPEIALISVGADNKYGHPTRETLKMLSDAHVQIYRTDEQGAISVFFTKEGMAIETER